MERSAFNATLPKATTSLGLTTEMVRWRNDEQFLTSRALGTSLFPSSFRGLQRIAFVMNMRDRLQFIAFNRSSNLSPVRSPKRGTPVTSAPSRPGASATNMTWAAQSPFRCDNTRLEEHILAHRLHAWASSIRCLAADEISETWFEDLVDTGNCKSRVMNLSD
jgi:hypothetical protein